MDTIKLHREQVQYVINHISNLECDPVACINIKELRCHYCPLNWSVYRHYLNPWYATHR